MHTTVSTRPRFSAASSARDLRTLMRDEGITTTTLQWILRCSRLRAFRLRHWSTRWTVQEACTLVQACAPASASVPVWGCFAAVAA